MDWDFPDPVDQCFDGGALPGTLDLPLVLDVQ